jgi:hypothetical protein
MLQSFQYLRFFLALLLALGLAVHGLKKNSLSPSGCLAAIFVGLTTFAVSYRLIIIREDKDAGSKSCLVLFSQLYAQYPIIMFKEKIITSPLEELLKRKCSYHG